MGSCYGRPPRQPTVSPSSVPAHARQFTANLVQSQQAALDPSCLSHVNKHNTALMLQQPENTIFGAPGDENAITLLKDVSNHQTVDTATPSSQSPFHEAAKSDRASDRGHAPEPTALAVELFCPTDTPVKTPSRTSPALLCGSPLTDSDNMSQSSSFCAMTPALKAELLGSRSGVEATSALTWDNPSVTAVRKHIPAAAVDDVPEAHTNLIHDGAGHRTWLALGPVPHALGPAAAPPMGGDDLAIQLQQDEAFARQAQFLAAHGFGSSEDLLVAAQGDEYLSEAESDADVMSYEELLRLGEAAGCVGRGLPPRFAAALPRSTYRPTPGAPRDRCVVCQEEFADGEDAAALPCHHLFHSPCISEWLAAQKVCPCCNQDVTPACR
mmetsp:Transcript_1937/g.5749  ORF Transcript_1937/g.5749 Transcript_1937/m.5749 type:complete len:383 (-) Transcript_1937:2000-3148(-)